MNKRTVIANLNKIANELDNSGKFNEASAITSVMKRLAQYAQAPVAAPTPAPVVQPAPVAPPFSTPVVPGMPAAPGTVPALGTQMQPATPAATVTSTTRPPYATSAGAQGSPTPQATSGDTANEMQAQNALPQAQAQQESNEQRLYMNALNDIENAFKQKDPNTANAIYEKTYNEFKNPRRKEFFAKQIQRVRTKYLKPSYNQGPTQEQAR